MSQSIDLLQSLAEKPMPLEIQPGPQLEVLRFIRAAGWVEASMPNAPDMPATVHDITFAGKAVLDQVGRYH